MTIAHAPVLPESAAQGMAQVGSCGWACLRWIGSSALHATHVRALPCGAGDGGGISDDFDVLHLRLFTMGAGLGCSVSETVREARG